jgi:hypothetical protein
MSKLIKPQNNFTTIPNHIINDDRLSFKAKGLFLYLISKPDGWTFSHDRIMLDNNDGERSVLSGLKELENFGLLSRSRVRVGGVYKGVDYVLSFEISPNRQNVDLVSPNRQNVDLQNVDLQNVDNNKDSLSKKDKVIEERENISSFSAAPLYAEFVTNDVSDYPLIEEYLDFVSKKAKHSFFYRATVKKALLNFSDSLHNKTFFAYNEFVNFRPDLSQNGVLPAGVNIFDLIGRG